MFRVQFQVMTFFRVHHAQTGKLRNYIKKWDENNNNEDGMDNAEKFLLKILEKNITKITKRTEKGININIEKNICKKFTS